MCSGVLTQSQKSTLASMIFLCDEPNNDEKLKTKSSKLIRDLLFIIIDAIESDVCVRELKGGFQTFIS